MKTLFYFFIALVFIMVDSANAEPVKYKKLQKKKWTLTESPNFSILSEASPKQIIKIAEQLERFRAFSSLLMAVDTQENAAPTELTVTKGRSVWKAMGLPADYASYTRVLGTGQSLIFSDIGGFQGSSLEQSNPGRAIVFGALAYELFIDVNLTKRVPLWYYRGLADYLAGYAEKDEYFRIGELEGMKSRLLALFYPNGNMKNLDVIKVMSRKSFVNPITQTEMTRSQRLLFSAQAYLMVHYFYASRNGKQQLADYIELMDNGQSIEQNIRQAFNMTPEALSKAVRNYATKSIKVLAYRQDKILSMITLPGEAEYTQRQIGVPEFWRLMYPRLLGISNELINYTEKKKLHDGVKQHLPKQESVLGDDSDVL